MNESRIPQPPVAENVRDVCIIGAGFSGIGLAIKLRDAGRDVIVIERADDIGGTWRDNRYPGAACDVMSLLYSFSFAPSTEWSRTFGTQSEILAYLNDCVDRFGIRDAIRLGEELLEAEWDENAQNWLVQTSTDTFRARTLVGATGYLSDPSLPDVPGLADFEGQVVHTSRWDPDIDLTGREVAVVGTGASAVQVVPAIQPQVAGLTLYQRTPAWVAPKNDVEISARQKWLRRRVPGYQRARRELNKWGREVLALMLARPQVMQRTLQQAAVTHLHDQVSDPELRAQLTPDYTIGCKRILFSNRFYPAIAAAGSTLVPHAVDRFTQAGIVADGVERRADVVVLATGFRATSRPIADRIRGRGRRLLREAWSDRMSAYLGTTVHGFPNLFLMLGPNTALAHSSQTVMIEAQIDYVVDALRVMAERHATSVEVRSEVQESFVDWIDDRLDGTVWEAGGCHSWYQHRDGRNPSLWPTFTWTFARRTSAFDPSDYSLRCELAPMATSPDTTPALTEEFSR